MFNKRTSSLYTYQPLSCSCTDLREKDVAHCHHGPASYTEGEGKGSDGRSSCAVLPGRAMAHRVKKSRVMRWLILHSNGTKQQMCLDKRQLIQHFNLDIPTRDMRLMDSTLMGATHGGKDMHIASPHMHHHGAASSAGQLLVRDNALVMCMEHVRMIITADKVFIPLEDERSEMNDRFNLHIEQVVQEWLAESMMDNASGHNTTAPIPQTPVHGAHSELSQHTTTLRPQQPHLPPFHPQQAQQAPPPKPAFGGLLSHTQPPQQQQQSASTMPRVHRRNTSSGALSECVQGYVPGRVTSPRGHSPVEHAPAFRAAGIKSHNTGNHQSHDPDLTYPTSLDGDSLGGADGTDGTDGPLLMTGCITPRHGTPSQRGDEELPFELAMLETGLGEACSFLAREADLLQAQSTPALEDLIANSDKNNLERVRRVKTAHQRLLSRVLTVREALHRLMEDDTDMWRMCLSKHASYKALAAANAADQEQLRQQGGASAEGGQAGSREALPSESPVLPGNASVRTPSLLAMKLRQVERAKNAGAGDPRLALVAPEIAGSPSIENLDEDDWHDLLDVENLLEAYFTIADSTQTTLAGIGEYIDDTEDLVNINLDNSRNKLIRFEILLTTGTFALSSYSVVAGILGENLVLPDFITQDINGFVLVNGLLVMLSTIIFFTIYKALKSRKLL